MGRVRWVVMVLVACLLITACGSAATHTVRPTTPSAARTPTTPDYGPFGGYQELGPAVHTISALITVPRSGTGQTLSAAGTWVGAEHLGSGGLTEPFIQAGVNEISPGHGGAVIYYTFWTDTTRNFHPVTLFVVRPGDQVSAQMVHTGDRWIITVQDRSLGRERRIVTAEEGQASFREALWLQEDVTTNLHTMKLAPYPTIGNPRFSDVQLNGHAPAPTSLNSSWPSVHGTVREPTPLRDDAFSVAPSTHLLAPHVARLIARTQGRSSQTARDLAAVVTATTLPAPATRRRLAQETATDLTGGLKSLSQEHFPAGLTSQVSAVRATQQAFAHQIETITQLSAGQFGAWVTAVNAAEVTSLLANARLLREMGWPAIPVTAGQ